MRALIVIGAAALILAAPATASMPLGDLNISDVRLAVNKAGVALLDYRQESGRRATSSCGARSTPARRHRTCPR